jgi:signal transduction histidine kinase
MAEIIIAVITGVATIVTVVLTNNKSSRDVDAKLEKNQAVTDTKLDELTREVRLHNGFAQRMPVVEEQIKVINHRIGDLEQYHKGV